MKRSRARSPESIEFARSQRRTSNEFAATIWQWIRNRQIDGTKFRREYPIPPYTVDFCCIERRLIIEVDGEGHFTEEGLKCDRVRDRFLRNLGYKILRIPGYAVIREDGDVLTMIREFVRESGEVKAPSPPAPLPFVPQGRGEPEGKAQSPLMVPLEQGEKEGKAQSTLVVPLGRWVQHGKIKTHCEPPWSNRSRK